MCAVGVTGDIEAAVGRRGHSKSRSDAARHPAALLDLRVVVLLGGRERTEPQWRALLERGGFGIVDIQWGIRAALVEAVPR